METIGVGERLVLSALRLISSGQNSCGAIHRVFDDMLGDGAPVALDGMRTISVLLPRESERTLTLGALCVRGVTWDEAAILALLEAAQRSDVRSIMMWFGRLGVKQPTGRLQRGLAWLSGAIAVSSCRLQRESADLTTCQPAGPDEKPGMQDCE